jgi:hypothetical protein
LFADPVCPEPIESLLYDVRIVAKFVDVAPTFGFVGFLKMFVASSRDVARDGRVRPSATHEHASHGRLIATMYTRTRFTKHDRCLFGRENPRSL